MSCHLIMLTKRAMRKKKQWSSTTRIFFSHRHRQNMNSNYDKKVESPAPLCRIHDGCGSGLYICLLCYVHNFFFKWIWHKWPSRTRRGADMLDLNVLWVFFFFVILSFQAFTICFNNYFMLHWMLRKKSKKQFRSDFDKKIVFRNDRNNTHFPIGIFVLGGNELIMCCFNEWIFFFVLKKFYNK
jgi:hypothetical protein